jgi:hypothetical protein
MDKRVGMWGWDLESLGQIKVAECVKEVDEREREREKGRV